MEKYINIFIRYSTTLISFYLGREKASKIKGLRAIGMEKNTEVMEKNTEAMEKSTEVMEKNTTTYGKKYGSNGKKYDMVWKKIRQSMIFYCGMEKNTHVL